MILIITNHYQYISKTSPDDKITGKDLKVSDFHFTPGTILVELSLWWQDFILALLQLTKWHIFCSTF